MLVLYVTEGGLYLEGLIFRILRIEMHEGNSQLMILVLFSAT